MTGELALYSDVSKSDGEPVCVLERVSTDQRRQDIDAQTRDLKEYIRNGSYRVVKVLRFEASAYKGKHESQLAEVKADVANGLYSTVLAAMSSRYERRGAKAALRFALDLDDMGARVIAIDDDTYGDVNSDMGIISTVLKAKSNYEFSKSISENVRRQFRKMASEPNPAFRGGIPAGYEVHGEKYAKYLEPHRLTAAVVRKAFDDAANVPPSQLARRFKGFCESNGLYRDINGKNGRKRLYELPVTRNAVTEMLRRDVYSTGRQEVSPGVFHVCEPLVTPETQRAAIEAIKNRRQNENRTSPRQSSEDDFSGALLCGVCETGRMYRKYGGVKKYTRKDGSVSVYPSVRMYCCEKCRRTVRADNADQAVNELMESNGFWWIEPVTEDPRADIDRKLIGVNRELLELPSLGLDEETEDTRRAELRAMRRELENQRANAGDPFTWGRIVTDADGNSLTEGDRWKSLSMPVRRDELLAGHVKIWARVKPGRTGDVLLDIWREGEDQQ